MSLDLRRSGNALIDCCPLSYHDDVNDWQFGKLSAMREILLAIEDGYKYYYMGSTMGDMTFKEVY